MRFWKWVWPWNWQKVRKAQSPLPDKNSFRPADEELEQRGKQFAERAAQLLEELTPHSAVTHGDIKSLQYFLQSQNCYAELSRRQDIRRADRERTRETRHFWIELIVIGLLIVGEIGLSLYFGLRGLAEGRQQAAILSKVNDNTTATAAQIQRAADAMTAFLKIAQQQEAERARRPKFALYNNGIPVDKTSLGLSLTVGENARAQGNFDLVLKNEGDAAANPFALHLVEPDDVSAYVTFLPGIPESGELLIPRVRRLSYQVPFMHAGDKIRLQGTVQAPKDCRAFKLLFSVSTPQLPFETTVGFLSVLPPKT